MEGGRGGEACFYIGILNLVHMVTAFSACVHCRMDSSDGGVSTELFILSMLMYRAPLVPVARRLPLLMRLPGKGFIPCRYTLKPGCT